MCTVSLSLNELPYATLSTVRRRGVVGGVPAFQTGGPGSIPGGVRNFYFYHVLGCMSFVFCPVLSLALALTSADHREACLCVSIYCSGPQSVDPSTGI